MTLREKLDALADSFADAQQNRHELVRAAARLAFEYAAWACELQGRNSSTLDGDTFYTATGQCAAAIRREAAKIEADA